MPPTPREPSTPGSTTPPGGAGLSIGVTIPELLTTLSKPRAAALDRQEAARRLVARQTPESREALRQIVTSLGNAPARIAALRALADDPRPDPALLSDLSALLNDPGDRLVDAAAQALAAYKDNTGVVQALTAAALDANRLPELRTPVVRALGQLVEQPAAAALARIVTNPAEPPAVASAAADALVEMTALDANGRDAAKWQQWQLQNAGRPEAEWKADLLRARSAREDRLRRRAADAAEEVQKILQEQYEATAPDEKPALLLRYLRSSTPQVRRVGAVIADLVATRFLSGQNTREVQDRLVELVGDADAGVRFEAVNSLININIDADQALAALLPQLRVETDSRVKAKIASKLSNVPRTDQINALLELLNDASPEVIHESARAIRQRASQLIQENPPLAARAAQMLRDTMRRIAGRPGFLEARRTCGEALAVFRDPASMDFAPALLNPREPPAIRRVALTILGELGPRASDMIVRAVDDERDNADIRAEGVRALGRTKSFDQAEWLIQKMNPGRGAGGEGSADVRAAAERAYLDLLPSAAASQLATQADRRKNNPALRIAVLKELVARLKASGRPQDLEDAANQQQNIGVEYLNNVTPPREAEAVPYLRAALDYWRSRDEPQAVTARLVPQLITAMLKSRQYAPLINLAQDLITKASPEDRKIYQAEIGSRIRNEAEALLAKSELDAAADLVAAALKMDPPLDPRYRPDLEQIGRQAEALRRRGGPRDPAAR